MDKLYLEAAATIKKIMAESFSFDEALKIYKAVNKNVSIQDNLIFMDELFDLTQGSLKASVAYDKYLDWANQFHELPMSATKFGIILSKVTRKTRKTDGIYYEMSVK